MYRLYQHVRADHGIAVVQCGEQGGVRAAQVQPVSSAAHLSEGNDKSITAGTPGSGTGR